MEKMSAGTIVLPMNRALKVATFLPIVVKEPYKGMLN